MGLEPLIMGVLSYRQALDPLPVGGARDCWPPPARVVVVVVVGVMEVVEVGVDGVPPVDDRDDDAHDALNPRPPCLGRPPVAHNK